MKTAASLKLSPSASSFAAKTSTAFPPDQRKCFYILVGSQKSKEPCKVEVGEKEIYGGRKNTRIRQLIQMKAVAELRRVPWGPRSAHRLKHGNAPNLGATYGNNVNNPQGSIWIFLGVKLLTARILRELKFKLSGKTECYEALK